MISIVLYGRNDNYGYNLPKRGALGLNCMAEVLTDPDDEILFVDYNTPDDFPTFPEAIADTLTEKARQRLRIFRVRPAHHQPFATRTHLQTVEPIARNVAIRRSNPANRWVLSTNTEMIFVPRNGHSLTEVVEDLPRGFYAIPRFEIPESLWESFNRTDPQAVLHQIERWGWDAFLNDVAYSTGVMFHHDRCFLYDAPGDFQLVERDDFLAIDGFNESMVLGWHLDSNLFRRLSLLHGGAETSDLIEQLFGYHCTHTRQLTAAHKRDAPANDLHEAFYAIKKPHLSQQRETWGLAGTDIEEISLQQTPTAFYVDTINATLAAEGVGELSAPRGRIDYDERHVLPFLLNVFVNSPRTLSVAWIGTEPEMFRLFERGWREMGFSGDVLVPTEYAGVLGGKSLPGVQIVPEAWVRADAAIFDFAQRTDLTPEEQWERNEELADTLYAFCVVERLLLTRKGTLPRRVVTINAFYNAFESLVRERLDCTVTPYCTRIRTGFVAEGLEIEHLAPANDVLVIVPTRSRPAACSAFVEEFLATSTRSDLLFALDEDDPLLGHYTGIPGVLYEVNPRLHRVGTLNLVANKYLDRYAYLAVMSDLHRIRTPGWDQQLVDAIAGVPAGIAYGSDLQDGETLPHAVLMHADIVRTLGFIAPPVLIHHGTDAFWRDLGQALGSLRYCEDVVIAHHGAPSPRDDANADPGLRGLDIVATDQAAYERYVRSRIELDSDKLREAQPKAGQSSAAAPVLAPDQDSWQPGEDVPDLVAASEMQSWNDTTTKGSEPWRLTLPAQQWAYGIVFPVHCPPQWSPHRRATVTLDLEVHSGSIGIFGVTATLAQVTTKEIELLEGEQQAFLRINPLSTKWIVLRTTSETEATPQVTLRAISAKVAGQTSPLPPSTTRSTTEPQDSSILVSPDPSDAEPVPAANTSPDEAIPFPDEGTPSPAMPDPESPAPMPRQMFAGSPSIRVDLRAGSRIASAYLSEAPRPDEPIMGDSAETGTEPSVLESSCQDPNGASDEPLLPPPEPVEPTVPLPSPQAASAAPITWEPGTPLPGLVALDAMQTSNNASVESCEPWLIQLPEEQWAYGVLIPVHCPEGWPSELNAIVRLELEVHRGRIGVLGVDATTANPTTVEHHATFETRRIDLCLNPHATQWIVLRTSAATETPPRMTITEVSAWAASDIAAAEQSWIEQVSPNDYGQEADDMASSVESALPASTDLFTWDRLEELPGLLGLDLMQTSNDATLEPGPPWRIQLPEKQWGNGVLIPVVQPLEWSAERSVIVSLDMEVHNGRVGIAGVDESLRNLATLEREISVGTDRIELLLDPLTTRWIVLRTTSDSGEAPIATIASISAHVAGEKRVNRRTDGRPDFIVVLSPEKTASISAEKTIGKAVPSIPVRRTHFLTDQAIAYWDFQSQDASRPAAVNASCALQAQAARLIRAEIELVSAAGGRVAFISGVREPLGRMVSERFQSIEHDVPLLFDLYAADANLAVALAAGLEFTLRSRFDPDRDHGPEPEWAWLWRRHFGTLISGFQVVTREVPQMTGIDPLQSPFDRERGYSISHHDAVSLLLYRFEDLPGGLAAGLAELLSHSIESLATENRTADKPLAQLYREFQERLHIPAEAAAWIYDKDPATRHFYSEEEIAGFIRKWSG